MKRMLSVKDAIAAIRSALAPLPAETVAPEEAAGRVLASPVIARLTQPPFNSSAMDGYAVRLDEAREAGAILDVVGVSSAGAGFHHPLPPGCAVRIFTGAPVPEGADHILIQEEAESRGEKVVITVRQQKAPYVRAAGIDFREGDLLLHKGARLSGAALALAAAGNVAAVAVATRPRIAIIANGDELVLPGAAPGRDQIVSSIQYGLSPHIEEWGAAAAFLGIAWDDKASIRQLAEAATGFDLIAPIGGASVGDHDFMRTVFEELGFSAVFQGVSVRPGKPTWFSAGGAAAVLGLPGNPASALVTARLFLKPAIERLLGAESDDRFPKARLAKPIGENGPRETYLRARVTEGDDGVRWAAPFDMQDSSLLSVMAQSNALIRREIGAPAANTGELVEYLAL